MTPAGVCLEKCFEVFLLLKWQEILSHVVILRQCFSDFFITVQFSD